MHRFAFAALLASLALSTLVLPSRAMAAPRKPQGAHTPAAPNPYVVSDPDDPSVLHAAPGFGERGFDRGWVEMMARPRIPSHVLDELERLVPSAPVPLSLPEPGIWSYAATVVRGDIIVVEGTSSLVANTQRGLGFNHNSGMFEVLNQVLARYGDVFDFITVWTTFPDQGLAAYYVPLKNDVRGLGACNPNASETFGCTFDNTKRSANDPGLRLQGVIFMNALAYWAEWDLNFDGRRFDVDDFNSSIYSTLGQEVAHRWGSGLRFVDPRTGNVSRKLLGRDNSHWAAYVDTDASVMDGWDWARPVSGRFDLVNDMDNFSTLDLYTMGALPVAAARPFFFIDDATFVEDSRLGLNGRPIPSGAVLSSGLPSVALMEEYGIDLGAKGEMVELTIQDIVDAEGQRCPDPDHTQKSFRQAMVLVTRPGQTAAAAQGDVDRLQIVSERWEEWWSEKTGKALTLCTNLDEECEHAELSLGGGTIESDAGDAIELGSTIRIIARPRADGDDVRNARLRLSLDGSGAGATRLPETELPIGLIREGEELEVPIEVEIGEDYDCGKSVIVVADLVADNAATVREEFRLFPGHALVFVDNFAAESAFTVNADGRDRTTTGALEQVKVELSCTMTKRTPERDMTPGSKGAFVTGKDTELDGDTSLWSPRIDLGGTVDPIVTFDFWLEGDPGDYIVVQLSADGEDWEDVFEDDQQIHGWGLGRVKVRDAFNGELPSSLFIRFLFAGKGRLEGAVDNVQVFDAAGQCLDRARSAIGCGCSAQGEASPQAGLAVILGVLGARLVRRRAWMARR